MSLTDMRQALHRQPNLYEIMYNHWDIGINQKTRVRFLPDGNEANPLFWVERQSFHLHFQYRGDRIVVKVPCLAQYGRQCKILNHLMDNFDRNDPEIRPYWRKRAFFLQGIIIQNAIEEEKAISTNATRIFKLDPYCFQRVKDLIVDPTNEINPVDYKHGLDFVIKNTDSKYNFENSYWSDKRSSIDTNLIKNIYDLSTFLPKEPTEAEHFMHYRLFLDSLNKKEFNPSNYYGIKYRKSNK